MTKIFESYSEFLDREDVKCNGVSEEFAQANPNFEKQNETNEGCWNCSGCSDCSDCSGCYGCSGCSGCSRCSGCYGCSRCSGCYGCYGCSGCSDCSGCYGCSGCSGCSDCSDCSDCSGCYGLSNASPVEQSEENPNAGFVVPIIEGIHSKVLAAIESPGHNLNMDSWHSCDTTHCRAGWVVHLAGKEGYELERKTTTAFAAMQIYHKSSPIKVSPVRFYEGNSKALDDIKRCAEEESKISNN